MKKLDLIKALAMAFVIVSGVSAQTVWDGTADQSWYDAEQSEFTITTAEQLAGLAELSKEGNTFENKVITLGADIMLNDTTDWQDWAATAPANSWTPICRVVDSRFGENLNRLGFKGAFNGDGHIVSGVYTNYSENDNQYHGLFGYIGTGGTVTNLGVVASYVKGGDRVGGLAGVNDGTITNCYATGNVTGDYFVGGLVGVNDDGTITNCYATGNVTGDIFVGGLAGYNADSWITNCYATGNVTGSDEVGGLVGENDDGTITNCYATGNVTGDSFVGGLVGESESRITNCYATGNVTGDEYVGGLVGEIDYGTITNCYATGNVTGDSFVGGLVGVIDYELISITNCYYDSQTSGQSDNDKGTPKTTAQMKQKATYVGWDFSTVWAIDAVKNNGYPYLRSFGENQGGNTSIAKKAAKNTTQAGFAGIRNGQINLNLKAGVYTAQIYNLQGRLVKSADINAINGINATGLRTDNLSKGIFILNVKQSGVSVLRHKVSVK